MPFIYTTNNNNNSYYAITNYSYLITMPFIFATNKITFNEIYKWKRIILYKITRSR